MIDFITLHFIQDWTGKDFLPSYLAAQWRSNSREDTSSSGADRAYDVEVSYMSSNENGIEH